MLKLIGIIKDGFTINHSSISIQYNTIWSYFQIKTRINLWRYLTSGIRRYDQYIQNKIYIIWMLSCNIIFIEWLTTVTFARVVKFSSSFIGTFSGINNKPIDGSRDICVALKSEQNFFIDKIDHINLCLFYRSRFSASTVIQNIKYYMFPVFGVTFIFMII